MAGRYEVRVRGGFSAIHQLRLPEGGLEPVHGHDWKVEAVFRAARLEPTGWLIDFEEASAALGRVLAVLHHGDLNTLDWLEGANPTAEHVARLIHRRLRAELGSACPLAGVCVEEAPGCVAGYWADTPNA